MNGRRLSVALVGGGNRGADVYGTLLRAQEVDIVALVEPRPARRRELAARFGLGEQACHAHWDGFFDQGRRADAVVIATPDDLHVQPCLRALALGYDVLLEKPVCLDEAELDLLLAAEAVSAGSVTVCHVLRWAPFFREVRGMLDSGRLGDLVGIVLAENVAYWHYAHSFVRGNWRQSPPAAPFLLAKSCHDLDLLRWFADAAPARVSSDGQLHHFRPEQAPAGASARCLSCPVERCPYDARRIYGSRPAGAWPVTVLTAGGLTLDEALATGPYGECVYLGRNDVVDHQAVSVTFGNGVQAQLTVSAFTHNNTRTLKLLGTQGELRGHMERSELEWHDFRSGEVTSWIVPSGERHGGGDEALVQAWVAGLRDQAPGPSPLSAALDSHRMAFAAERSRLTWQTVQM